MSMVEIDERDPSVTWTGNWKRTGVPSEHDNTVSGSYTAGATANVTFIGTSIIVYGTIPQADNATLSWAQSSYTLDGGSSVVTLSPCCLPTTQYRQRFFASSLLPYGRHNLFIVNVNSTRTGLWLDYFAVTTGLGTDAALPITTGLNTNISPSSSAQPIPKPTMAVTTGLGADTALSVTTGLNTNTALTSSVQGTPKPTDSTNTTALKVLSKSRIIAISSALGVSMLIALGLTIYLVRRCYLRRRRDVKVAQTTVPFPLHLAFHDHNVE